MQADEFEKKIQDKMEGFELVPDTEVWKQVSLRIKKEKKKRKALIFWFATAFVLLTLTSTWLLTNSGNTGKPVITDVNNNKASTGQNDNLLNIEKHQTNQTQSSLSRLSKNPIAQTKKDIAYFKNGDIKHEAIRLLIKKDATPIISNNKKPGIEITPNKEKPNDIIVKAQTEILRPLPRHRFYNPNATPLKNTEQLKGIPKDALANAVAEKSIKVKLVTKKLKLGFTIYTGVSDNLSGLPLVDKSLAYDNASSSAIPPTTSNNNYLNSSTIFTAGFTSGFSFGFGIFVKKDFTSRISLSAGLDYHQYNAVSKVGKRVNSPATLYDSIFRQVTTLNAYYNNGNSVKYANKYRLAELPIILGIELNDNPQKPFIISAAISPAYLIGSNALYANPSANVFYVDKQKFHRFQLSAQAGLSLPIKASPGYLLSAGPVVQYGFTNVAKTANATQQYLFFTGIKANITLK